MKEEKGYAALLIKGMRMNDETKKQLKARYERELNRGERFWPDSIFKDLIVSLAIFIVLILLATFVGVENAPKADPSDASYIPRPEWYFLFLFKFLAIYGQIPVLGKIEWIATVLFPGAVLTLLFVLPLVDKNPRRHYSRRLLALCTMAILITGMVLLTLIADVPTTSSEAYGPLSTALQFTSGLIVPGVALIALFILTYLIKYNGRILIGIAGTAITLMIGLTAAVLIIAPVPERATTEVAGTLAEQIFAGQDLYSVNCVECHGPDGEGGEVKGVEGFEGVILKSIRSKDVLFKLTDESLANVIDYGQQELEHAMPPFGKTYVGADGLGRSEIDYIVTFMRYSWDDRFELPAEALKPLYPPLAEGEVPSYEIHIAPIVKRYCISCHREGKQNNNYWMTSYAEIINTGDNAPSLEEGNMESALLKVIQQNEIKDDNGDKLIGVMPPNRALKPDLIDVFIRWVLAGMPETADEAAVLSTTPTPAVTPTPTP
jgi:quinol-cytochrome oxidoreductase complex cytochrome b subunit